MSTTINIQSAPASFSINSAAQQIVSFDLDFLGQLEGDQSGNITRAWMTFESTHDPGDQLYVIAGNAKGRSVKANEELDCRTALLIATMNSRTTLPTTIRYDGQGQTTLTCTLHVTLENAPVTDTRSSGELSAEAVTFGNTISMTITPLAQYARTYSHRLTWSLGEAQSTQNVPTPSASDPNPEEQTVTFTLPTNWLNAVPTATTGTLQVVLDTLSNGVSVGTRTYTAEAVVPTDILPSNGTFSVAPINPAGITGDPAPYLAGASALRLTLTGMSAGTGSTITSVTFSGWGDSITVQPSGNSVVVTTGVVQTPGVYWIYALVTDARGRSPQMSASCQITVKQYDPPYFTSTDWVKCDAEGQPSDTGNHIKVTAVYGCSTAYSAQNVATAKAAIRARTSEPWNVDDPGLEEMDIDNDYPTVFENVTLTDTVGYELRFIVTDMTQMKVVRYMTVPSKAFLIHFSNSGNAIGIGQAAEAPGAGEIGRITFNPDWDVYIGGQHAGGGSGSDEMIPVTGTTPTITATRNMIYVCDEVTSLSFTPSSAGICAVIFKSGTTPAVINFGNNIVWPDWFAGICEANRTYEISVMNGKYAAVLSWSD